VGLEAAAMPA